MSSIFLCHSYADKSFVNKLAKDLRKSGYYVWTDDAEIKIGDSLIRKICEGIDTVAYVGAIISHNSINSEWVQKELDIAMNQEIEGRKVKVLPLLLENVDLPGFLKGKRYADFRDKRLYNKSLNEIKKRLEEFKDERLKSTLFFKIDNKKFCLDKHYLLLKDESINDFVKSKSDDIKMLKKHILSIFGFLSNAYFVTGDINEGDDEISLTKFARIFQMYFGENIQSKLLLNEEPNKLSELINFNKLNCSLCSIGGPVDTFTTRKGMGYDYHETASMVEKVLKYWIVLNKDDNKRIFLNNPQKPKKVKVLINGNLKEKHNFCIEDNLGNFYFRELNEDFLLREDFLLMIVMPNFFSKEPFKTKHLIFAPIHGPAQMAIPEIFSNKIFFNVFKTTYDSKCSMLGKMEYYQVFFKIKITNNLNNNDYSITDCSIFDFNELHFDRTAKRKVKRFHA